MAPVELALLAAKEVPEADSLVALVVAKAALAEAEKCGGLGNRAALRKHRKAIRQATFDAAGVPGWARVLGWMAYLVPGPAGIALRLALFVLQQVLGDDGG